MPAAGSKNGPKNPAQVKDDTSSARQEKQVMCLQIMPIIFFFA